MKINDVHLSNIRRIIKILSLSSLVSLSLVGCFGFGDKKPEEAVKTSKEDATTEEKAGMEDGGEEVAKDDNSMIIQAILTNKKLEKVLTAESAPIQIFGKGLENVKLTMHDQPVGYADKETANQPGSSVVWFKKIKITDNNAEVHFTHGASGKKGRAKLEKGEDGMWKVKKMSLKKDGGKKSKKKMAK